MTLAAENLKNHSGAGSWAAAEAPGSGMDLRADAVKWEWRVFWTEPLAAMEPFSAFSVIPDRVPDDIAAEINTDTYILISGNAANLKLRGDAISCKTLLSQENGISAYGKKQAYPFPVSAETLCALTGIAVPNAAGSADELIKIVLKHRLDTKIIAVEKDRKTAKYKKNRKTPGKFKKMKAEFSVLRIEGRVFHTFCLESKHRKWLNETMKQINIGDGYVMNYTDFLSFLASGRI
jgi:hypothetical protein